MTNEKRIRCEECGGKIIEGIDSRGYNFCEKCGLVTNEYNPMGHGINGLIDYMNHHGLQDSVDIVRAINSIEGLCYARLLVSKL